MAIIVILCVLCLSAGMASWASYRNRHHAIAFKRIRDTVHDCLTARKDIAPCISFLSYDPKLDVDQKFLYLLEQIAHIFGVPSTKLRPSDLLGDFFYGTVKEGSVADVRYVEFFDELYEVSLPLWIKRSALRDVRSDVFFLTTGEDAVLDSLSKMTIAEFVKRIHGCCNLQKL